MKHIRYSAHLQARLALRKIEPEIPSQILREAEHVFEDTATGYEIAVAEVIYLGGKHLMLVAYEETKNEIVVITVHPLNELDMKKKIKNGRWIS